MIRKIFFENSLGEYEAYNKNDTLLTEWCLEYHKGLKKGKSEYTKLPIYCNLKVYDENSSLMIDKSYTLSDICAENNIAEYNTFGQYAIEFSGGGFMDIRNVSITAPVADIALIEKIADGESVTASVVYQSPAKVPVAVIGAAYDVTGALIAVDVKTATNAIDKIDFNMTKSINADAAKVKFFLIDTLEALTPMCAALEVAVQ